MLKNNEYTNWERSPRSAYGYRDAVLELLSDGLTAAPLVQLSHLHSLQGGRSYFLHFKHQSHEWKFPQRSGSVRGEDVPFALGFSPSPMFPLTLTRLDMQVSSTVMRYLCNFVKTGNPNGLRSPRMDVFVNSNNKRSWNPAKKPHNETLMRQLLSSFRQQQQQHDPLQPRNPLPAIPGQSLLTPEQALMQQQLQQYYHKEANSRQQKHSRRKRTRYSNDFQRYNSDETGGYGSSEETGLPGSSAGNEGQDGDEDGDDDDDRQDGGGSSAGGRSETEPSYYSVDSDYVYSGFATIKYNLPFWGHYDTTNQVFMEIGSQVVPKSHYRGHKLSLWLSLIPQLHSSFNIPELSMRHHHFSEENPMFYDGLVREQIIEPPLMHIGFVTSTTSKMHKTETIASTILQSISTECPPNITFIQTASASWPLHNSALPAHHGDSNQLCNQSTQYDLAEVSQLLVTSTDPAPRPTMTSIATMTRRRDLREDFRSTPAISGSTRSLVTARDYTHRDGTELLAHGSGGAGILRPPSLHQLHHHPHQHLHHLHQPQQPLQQQQQQMESSSNSKKRVQIQEISV
uniref:COesterase domain-containing protein n=1 Tax=Anopheles maculatus TaxID=74869 RepID=A0A182STH5_9DIPT